MHAVGARPSPLPPPYLSPGCVMIVKSAWAQASLMWVMGFASLYAYYV
jgi:hypothetical protein